MANLVLVTGGAGFIGSHLCEALLARGYGVRVLDNLSTGKREWIPEGAQFLEGDVTNLADCRAACGQVSGVFHCAAMSRSGPSNEAIEECTAKNVVGTQNVLLAARESGARKLVYSGSSTYYGNRPPPHIEDLPPDYLNFYGLSKHVGEEYCRLFGRLFNIDVTVLRYFNVYGPRQPKTGPYALVLGIFIERWSQSLPLEIHGSGQQRRDFVHVRDVAMANIAAYERGSGGQTLNVGSGTNISIKQLADMISPDQIPGPRRQADAEVTLADITRIRSQLGWQPMVSFTEGLAEMKRLTEE